MNTVIVKRVRRTLPEPVAAVPAEWWTPDECARALRVDVRTLIEYRKLGLPYISIPGANIARYNPASVDAWMASHERRST